MSAEQIVIDVCGQRCPQPVLTLSQAARDLAPGVMVMVLATDPLAPFDIEVWCRRNHHQYIGVSQQANQVLEIGVRLR